MLAVAAALRSVLALALTIAVAVVVQPGMSLAQGTTTVRGRVTIGIPVSTRRPTNAYSRSVQATHLAPVSELRNVVVYLKNAPRGSVRPTRAEIRQVNETFIPRAVAVTVGSEVSFPNGDPFYHNVFSLSRARTFDLGRYPSGHTRTVRFDKPGVVKVFCQIHSHMSASVMVFEHPWFAVPDDDGRFVLDSAPPGSHQLVAWHERLGETTVDVRLDAGRPATVDFVLPVPRH
jgi:plastocyanin